MSTNSEPFHFKLNGIRARTDKDKANDLAIHLSTVFAPNLNVDVDHTKQVYTLS